MALSLVCSTHYIRQRPPDRVIWGLINNFNKSLMWQKYKFPNHARIVNHSRSISWPAERRDGTGTGTWRGGKDEGSFHVGFSVFTWIAALAWCLNQQIIFRPRPLLLLLTSPKTFHDLWFTPYWNPIFPRDNKSKALSSYEQKEDGKKCVWEFLKLKPSRRWKLTVHLCVKYRPWFRTEGVSNFSSNGTLEDFLERYPALEVPN